MNKTRILIVEDESIVAWDLRQQLVELGYEPVANTGHGEEAITLAGQLRPDLVLMDIHLAGELDGIVAARTIRDQLALPVVFLTAYLAEEMLSRAKLAEPYGFLIKPFDERQLRIAIEMALYKHQAERTLQVSEERHRYILQTAMDGFWLTDLEGRLMEVNETYCRMSGYSSPELLARRVTDLEATEVAADTAAHLQKVRAQGEDRFETRHRRKDGSVFAVEISVQYQPADGGRLVAFLRDMTERKRAEEALRQQAEELRVRNDRLNRFNQVAVGRELRMIELKREVNELCGKLGETPRHRIVETAPTPPAAPETQV